MPDVHHATVRFRGHVQGVGFRYATCEAAREFEVAGYVQNLPDGCVFLEVEGSPGEIDAFVSAVEEKMHGFIRKTERSSSVRTPQFSGFSIR